jgi:hypothetical protein
MLANPATFPLGSAWENSSIARLHGGAAIGFERSKVVIQGYANVTSLAARLDAGLNAKVIEHQ